MNPIFPQQLPAHGNRFFFAEILSALYRSKTLGIILFFAAHIPLGLLMTKWPIVSTFHAFTTLLVGIWFAGSSAKPEQVAGAAAYVTGAETLWRMTGAAIFWEFGKYALIIILLIAIFRSGRLKGPLWPLFYFLFMLPSIVLPMSDVGSDEFRNQVSFNLSGPLALAISVWYFSTLELTHEQIQRVFVSLIGPTTGVAAIALFDTLSASTIYFTNNSNFITSGGYGPNQVSTALGLGALMAFLLSLNPKASRGIKVVMAVMLIILTAQCALTFSRSGLYAAGGSAIIGVFYLFRLPKTKIKIISGIVILVLFATFIALPQLDSFTDGALSKRFINTKLTGRDRLIMADLQAWSDHPLFGVGPGQAKTYRQDYRANTSAHTEFSRMLAEHGSFGLAAIFLLLLMAIQYIYRPRPGSNKAITAAMISWSFFYMLTAAMRLVAPAFTFGLAAVSISTEDKKEAVTEIREKFD